MKSLGPCMKANSKNYKYFSGTGYAKVSFDGFINENYFLINSQEKVMAQNVEISHAITFNPITSKKDTFISIILKSKYDGIGNRQPIDLSIALDISGSMSTIDENNDKSRLTLAKESLVKLISIMDEKNDKISLITFNGKTKKIFGLSSKNEIQNNYLKKLNDIKASGGTNLIEALKEAITSLNIGGSSQKHKRIIMITDAIYKDTNNRLLNLFKECVEKKGISITIMAISSSSNLSLADKLCHFNGCNYFPICKTSELETYLVQNFKFIFFPVDYNNRLTVKSENAQIIKCIGGGNKLSDEYEDKFNEYAPGISNKITCDFGSSFPSELLNLKDDYGIDKLYIKGGLILLKVITNDLHNNKDLKFEINLEYMLFDNNNKQCQKYSYIIEKQNKNENEYFKDNNIKKGISIYYFTSLLNHLVEKENKRKYNNIIGIKNKAKKSKDLNSFLSETKHNVGDYLINNFTLEPNNQETSDNLSNYLKLIEERCDGYKKIISNNSDLSAPPLAY